MRKPVGIALLLCTLLGPSCEGGTEVGNPVISIGFTAYDVASSALRATERAPAQAAGKVEVDVCLLYTSPSPRDGLLSRMPSSA